MPPESQGKCPICKLEQQYVHTSDYGEYLIVECARCGKFTIDRTTVRIAESRKLNSKLSAWIREHKEFERKPPDINSNSLDEIDLLLPNYRVSEKQLLLLRSIERRTSFPGQTINIKPRLDYPLAWSVSEDEFRYHLNSLFERKLVTCPSNQAFNRSSIFFDIIITPSGWAFLDQYTQPNIINDQVFVAMSFAPELKSAWEQGIRPALTKAKFRPYRIDVEPHIERIDLKIITEIKNSKFMVADVTQQRPGVYFEAGYAIGIGLPVLWSVREDDKDNVHFDTRQYNHIIWKTEEDLAVQLFFFISAIIGIGSTS
jgi:nucleoside 2-deoxyribosyltransferase